MSKVLWIIGNGFDKNLGLKTGYRSFLLNKYFAPGETNEYRDELVRRLDTFDPKSQSDLWSDLERLLGEVSQYYEDDVDLFHETFEDIQRQLLEYVAQEAGRLPNEFPPAAIDEFRESLCLFSRRLEALDQIEAIPEVIPSENAWVSAISLNYTNSFDSLWNSAIHDEKLNSVANGAAVISFYPDHLLHLHGVVDSSCNGDSPIFGVSDQSQISSSLCSEDPDFIELWVKSERNASLLRNTKGQMMASLVSSANAICIYGCSLGLSDAYIWKIVGRRITTSATRLYIFDHELPDRRTGSFRRFQTRRKDLIDSFLKAAEIKEPDKETANKHIVPVESSKIFKFDSLLKLSV